MKYAKFRHFGKWEYGEVMRIEDTKLGPRHHLKLNDQNLKYILLYNVIEISEEEYYINMIMNS